MSELYHAGNGGVPPRWTVSEDEPIFGDGPFSEAEQILAKVTAPCKTQFFPCIFRTHYRDSKEMGMDLSSLILHLKKSTHGECDATGHFQNKCIISI